MRRRLDPVGCWRPSSPSPRPPPPPAADPGTARRRPRSAALTVITDAAWRRWSRSPCPRPRDGGGGLRLPGLARGSTTPATGSSAARDVRSTRTATRSPIAEGRTSVADRLASATMSAARLLSKGRAPSLGLRTTAAAHTKPALVLDIDDDRRCRTSSAIARAEQLHLRVTPPSGRGDRTRSAQAIGPHAAGLQGRARRRQACAVFFVSRPRAIGAAAAPPRATLQARGLRELEQAATSTRGGHRR